MNKLDGNSMNIVNENIEKLKEIFPEIFSENKIDFEKLQEELGGFVDDKNERYNFTWNGKAESKKIALTPSTGTLRPCKEESKNFDTTQNLYIEGDNLEVLKLLQKSYHKKVKMIYIDPPYNTGKDFVYKDNFKDNIKNYLEVTGQVDNEGNKLSTNSDTSGRYHSDWLNMMYPRLKLARNLLKEDGVIFISIDENETTNLKKICDEIFGEDNFLNEIVLENDSRARPYGSIATTHEYIIAYCKSKEFIYEILSNPDKEFKFYDNQGGFDLYELRNRNIAFNITNRPNLYYSFWVNSKNKDANGLYEISLDEKEGWVEVYPQASQGIKTVWRWGKDKASENLNIVIFGKESNSDSGFQIVKKYREDTYTLNTVWSDKEIKTDKGTLETKALFNNKKYFDFPKPVEMIKRLLTVGSADTNVVLDFFSGSGTTAHSVMKLNSEDNGNRKYICVQLPEETDIKSEAYKAGYKNICEIGKERIRRAGDKILEENKDKDLSDLDIGFKVLKLDSSNIKTWDSDYEDLEKNLLDSVDNIKEDRTNEDLLYEILLKYGLDLTLPIEELNINNKKVFNIGFGALIVCLESDIDTNTVEQIAELKKQYEEDYGLEDMKVVFKDNGFKDAVVKTNSLQILKQHNINEVVSI
jgi:adenine-specific DNA-methyltransferase